MAKADCPVQKRLARALHFHDTGTMPTSKQKDVKRKHRKAMERTRRKKREGLAKKKAG